MSDLLMQKDLRDWLNRYPAFLAVFFLSLGIVTAWHIGTVMNPRWLAVPAVALAGFCVLRRRFLGVFMWAGVAAVFFMVGLHGASKGLSLGQGFEPSGSRVVVHATVIKALATGPDVRILLLDSGKNVTEDRLLPGNGSLLLRQYSDPLYAGDRIAFLARLRKPVNRGNPGEYDWEIHNRHNGIGWLATVRAPDSILILRRGSFTDPRALLFRARGAMTHFLDQNAGRWFNDDCRHQIRAVLKGIVLGDYGELNLGATGQIDYSLNTSFVRSGLSHMLSASGLHVGIVALMALALVKVAVRMTPNILLWLPFRKIAALASIPAIIVYCLIVGSRVPAVRATVMGLVFACTVLTGRRFSSFNSLALAALLVLLMCPLSLFTPSFQLSFAAVFGILFVLEPMLERLYGTSRSKSVPQDLEENSQRGRGIADLGKSVVRPGLALLITPIAATVAVTPLLVFHFHNVPVYTVFANFLADVVMTAALPLGLVATVVGAIWAQVGAVLLVPADILVWIVIKIAAFFAGLPGSTVRVSHPGPLECSFMVAACFAVLWSLRRPSTRSIGLFAVSALGLVCVCAVDSWTKYETPTVKATFLNVGNGDATFVQVTDSHGVLIDGGLRTRFFDSGWAIVIPFLAWNGTRSLTAMIVTHPQADHMGGLVSVVREVPPKLLLRNTDRISDPLFDELLAASKANKVLIRAADRTCPPIQLGDATLRFLNRPQPTMPAQYASRDLNNASVVCRLEYGSVSFLFTGDLEQEGEEELLTAGVPLESDVLKVGHHGGKTATTKRFLDAVKPSVAIVSADYPPLRGAPNRGVLQRLYASGIQVLWTGRDGAITIETDGKNITRIVAGRGAKKKATSGCDQEVPREAGSTW